MPFPLLFAFALYAITHRGYHFQIEILFLMSLRFAFYSTMFSGIRKFCDYHFVSQFLLECIVDVLTNGLTCKFNNIFRKEKLILGRVW